MYRSGNSIQQSYKQYQPFQFTKGHTAAPFPWQLLVPEV